MTVHENITDGNNRAISVSEVKVKNHASCIELHFTDVNGKKLANELNLAPSKMESIEIASLLHDIGKISIPESILCKPGKLTNEEFEYMKASGDILKEVFRECRKFIKPGVTTKFLDKIAHDFILKNNAKPSFD